MNKIIIAVILLGICVAEYFYFQPRSSVPVNAVVPEGFYECGDAKGNRTYTNRPCNSNETAVQHAVPIINTVAPTSPESQDNTAHDANRESQAPYSCDGRTRCSQMHSCAEATWFIQHCPNTKMDGDGDGVPCESQWCG
jgi:hypothetical protein